MESTEYDKAVVEATNAISEVEKLQDSSDINDIISLAEFRVWFGHALMYIGQTERAMLLLQQVTTMSREDEIGDYQRRDVIVGRAHNHIGYIHWMTDGKYEEALREFTKAVSYFPADMPSHEYATALDNLGRVYAQLGHRSLAIRLIERGRVQRESLRNNSLGQYRYALSLHSHAVAYLMFGQPYRAVLLCEEALDVFGQLGVEDGRRRGEGLALLTMGTAERFLSTFWRNRKPDEANLHLNLAEQYLVSAAQIFGATDVALSVPTAQAAKVNSRNEKPIDEPIRLVQAYGELGCVYRERAILNKSPENLQIAYANESFKRAIMVADQHDYHVLIADIYEDIAQLYFRIGEYKEAEQQLRLAVDSIPEECRPNMPAKSTSGTFPGCSEDYWQQLGKIHILYGNIKILEKSRTTRNRQRNITSAVEHYVLAVSYFESFMTRPLSPENIWLYPDLYPQLAYHILFTSEIHDRLGDLKPDDLMWVRNNILPSLYQKHNISSRVQTFFERATEFIQRISGSSGLEDTEFSIRLDA